MKSGHYSLLITSILSTSLSSLVIADNVNGQTGSAKKAVETLDTISVTAQREEQASLDVPASVGVITDKKIKLDQVNVQKDLFNSIAGVRVTQTGSTLGHMTSIRMPNNTGPYYLFLQDGVPVQSSGFFNHNGLAYTNFSTAGSAEVLKGAGTALYGSDSVAGTINVISRDPSEKEGYSISSTLGSDKHHRLGISAGHKLSEDSSLGIELSNTGSAGWRDHTRSKRTEANITHFRALDDDNIIKTILSLNTTRADMAGNIRGLDALKANPESVGDIQSALDSGQEIQRKFDYARLSTEWTHFLNDSVELSTIAYLRKNRNRYVATWERNLPENDSQENSAGVLFKSTIDQGLIQWILGSDIEYTQSNRTYEQLNDYVPTGFGAPVDAGKIYDYDVNYLAISPYVNANMQLSKVLINAGLRYDRNAFNYTNNVADGQYGSSNYLRVSSDNDPRFTHWSPKLSLTYLIDSQQNVYARYANGFRIPQASRLYSLKTDNISFSLEPEVSNTFEIGYKKASSQQRLDFALYYMTIDDTIVRRENADGDRYYVNGGETTHQGAELSFLHYLTDQFSTRLAYSYSKHHFVNDEDFNDNEQAAAPRNVANIQLAFEPSDKPGLTMAIEFDHVGDYWLDDENTAKYSGHTITHLKTHYQVSKSLSLSAKINNLSNKIYAENASKRFGSERYTPGSPRQFFAGIEYDF